MENSFDNEAGEFPVLAYAWREYERWLRSAGVVPQSLHSWTPASGLIVGRNGRT